MFRPIRWEERRGLSCGAGPREERTVTVILRPIRWEERRGLLYGTAPREEEEKYR